MIIGCFLFLKAYSPIYSNTIFGHRSDYAKTVPPPPPPSFPVGQYNCSYRVPLERFASQQTHGIFGLLALHIRTREIDVYLWGMLRVKVYNNNARTEEILKESTQNIVLSISPAKLRCTVKKVLLRCDAFLRVKSCFNAFRYGQ
jgi:hypothetical protein